MILSRRTALRQMLALSGVSAAGLLAGCAREPLSNPEPEQFVNGIPFSQINPDYGLLYDGEYTLPPIPPEYLQGVNRRALVTYNGTESPGTIDIDPHAKFLYWVLEDGSALRYPISVGRQGRDISGSLVISRKVEWPGWTPTTNMLRSEPEVYGPFAGGIPGGLSSPLGARALYLYRGGRDTFYRIHGTNDLTSIGNSGSAGCIRLFNHDSIHLYNLVPNGTRVEIRSYQQSVAIEGAALANRGVELPAVLPGQDLYDARNRT